jgi:hypothetical protein
MIQPVSRNMVLGLCALALGLLALTANAAHAEIGAKWRVSGSDVGSLAPRLLIKEIESKSGSLSFTTKGGTGVLILCTAAEFDEGGALIGNGGISLGRILFKGCVTLLNEAPAPKCSPHTTGKAAGEILTLKFSGLIVLDKVGAETFDLVRFTPDEGTAFAHIELGETCAIGELVLVEGEMWVKDCKGNTSFLTEAVSHLAEEALNKLTALGQPAKIVGSAMIELEGGHNGLKWSGVPA